MAELKYSCEYAKTGRASCKKCKCLIPKDTLRMAFRKKSPFHDGLDSLWHHFDCFFEKFKPIGPEEIGSFENIRFEDQKRIEKSIEKALTGPLPPSTTNGKSSKKRKADAAVNNSTSEFTVEYAKSSRSACKLCENKIGNKEIRIGKLDTTSDDAQKFGPLNRYFHVTCFVTAREELGYYWSAEYLPNFAAISPNDQKDLLKKLKPIESTTKAEKFPKLEMKEEEADPQKNKAAAKERKDLKKQSDALFGYVENLKQNFSRGEIMQLYEENNITPIPDDSNKRLELLADALTFGLPEKCPNCGCCPRFNGCTYICPGNVSEWEKCTFETDEPKRCALFIAENLKEHHAFLKKYKFKSGKKRVFDSKLKNIMKIRANMELSSLTNVKSEGDSTQSIVASSSKPLSGYNIAILGKLPLKRLITQFGGNEVKKIDQSVAFVLSNEKIFKTTKSNQLKLAEQHKVPIVTEDVFDALQQGIAQALILSKITLWNKSEDQLKEQLENLNIKTKIGNTFKSGSGGSGKSGSKSNKLVYKSGAVVDPDSELENDAHILKEDGSFYNAVLNRVDVAKNKNSFYKIQLLEDDRLNCRFWVFRSWGRIGTTRTGKKVERFTSKLEAIGQFKHLYYEQTRNAWEDRKNFCKYPDAYFPVDVNYEECESKVDITVSASSSTLPEQVKNLISLIFDVSKMKQTMLEFELDLEKMPLGKLSKAQLKDACSTLKEISVLIEATPFNIAKITAATNKFYSLVPHCFGDERPKLIATTDEIAQKMQMLESLMDIELAYDIIQNVSSDKHPIDSHYEKLNANIEPLDGSSEEYQLIEKYMKNTHAKTHSSYSLEISSIFKVERSGEAQRFKSFESNPNRMLLWHGSRLSNFVGILSQGLRIAPPEAPVCGYMFGKGVYFADSVSKSANYCCASSGSSEGLMLLSEVALGQSMELTASNYVSKLDNKFSSVKGIGSSHPNPKKMFTMPGGIKVPIGEMVPNKEVQHTSLLYNEYIVYKEEQIKIRYLVNVKFNFSSLF